MIKLVIASLFLSNMVLAAATPANGEKLYSTNCASCHGNDGKAQTDVGKAVKAKDLVAGEFKQVKDKKKGVTEDDILGTMKTGVPGTGMASFAHLPEADRKAIAKFIVDLRKKK